MEFLNFLRHSKLIAYRCLTRRDAIGLADHHKVTFLSDRGKPTFFGYHDKTPFSADGKKLLAMSIASSDKKPSSECSLMNLGYFSQKQDGFFDSQFFQFETTTTWCWQQGCMLQWHPINSNSEVFFNKLVDESYGSVLFDINLKERRREYNYPIYACSPCGAYATTLNFSRLGRLRPGYGYSLIPDETATKLSAEDDGLFLLDLNSGERSLLVSLADLARDIPDSGSQHYVNHATFSLNSRRIVFFHLWVIPVGNKRRLRVCEFDRDNNSWREVESERVVSHYAWRDADSFIASTLDRNGKWHYALYNLEASTRTDLDVPTDLDGHPMFHPNDATKFVTDTYPDIRGDQHLLIVDLPEKKTFEVANLYSPFRYRGQVRCDLHPRWDREGKWLAVDAVQGGARRLGILKIN